MGSINTTTRDLADYANRRGPIEAQIKQARALGTPEGRRQAQELAKTPIPPPSLQRAAAGRYRGGAGRGGLDAAVLRRGPLPGADHGAGAVGLAVQRIGPDAGCLVCRPRSGGAGRAGAGVCGEVWGAPPTVADLAFDAASIARVLGANGGFSIAALTQPAGFLGADGWLALLPDGQVRRGLAVFRIERGGPQMIEPAPQSAAGTGG